MREPQTWRRRPRQAKFFSWKFPVIVANDSNQTTWRQFGCFVAGRNTFIFALRHARVSSGRFPKSNRSRRAMRGLGAFKTRQVQSSPKRDGCAPVEGAGLVSEMIRGLPLPRHLFQLGKRRQGHARAEFAALLDHAIQTAVDEQNGAVTRFAIAAIGLTSRIAQTGED